MSKPLIAVNGVVRELNDEDYAGWLSKTPAEPAEQIAHLEPYQFHALLNITGYVHDIDSLLADADPVYAGAARSKLDKSTFYRRDDPLLTDLFAAVGLTPEQVDDLWLDALEF